MSHIHIPDGVLPVWLWLCGWIATLVMLAVASALSKRADARRKVPLLGVVSALMLVAMSSEIVPIAYHINLTVVGGILLGPALSVIASFIVEVVLAMLGHGGVTVLGLNTIIIAVEMIVGWALFRALVRALGRRRAGLSSAIATVLALALTTTALVGIVWLGGSQATVRETGALDPADLRFENPLSGGVFSVGLFSGGEGHGHEEAGAGSDDAHDGGYGDAEAGAGLSVARFATVVYVLGPIGWFIEALITAAIVRYVAHVRPTLIFAGALAEETRRVPGDEAGGM